MHSRRRQVAAYVLLATLILTAAPLAADPPPRPDIPARAWLLLETQSQAVLDAYAADDRLPPASLTKLMTAYLLFGDLRTGKLRLDEPVTVSVPAARLPGARMFLTPGEQVPVEELLKGMLVQSGNDATLALVEHTAGGVPAFVARMNAATATLGLRDTHFANATGLSHPEHYSTARDLAQLAASVKREFPEYAGWFALREFRWAGISQSNRNLLLRDPGVDGLKTGHTQAAGYCLAASAARDGMQLIAIVLGAESESERRRAGQRLLDYGFRQHETRLAYRAGAAIARLPVWQGETDSVALGLQQDLYLTLPRGDFDRLQAVPSLPAAADAPIAAGTALGHLALQHPGRSFAEVPLTALETVPPGNLAKRSLDRLRQWFQPPARVSALP